MTPEEHFDEAERLLHEAVSYSSFQKDEDKLIVAVAQVHATLSLKKTEN